MASVTAGNSPRKVTCDICQKKFSRTDHLKRHQLRRKSSVLLACRMLGEETTYGIRTILMFENRFRDKAICLYILQRWIHKKVSTGHPVRWFILTHFCSDNLRDHYVTCLQRKNRQIPEASRGGRRSHACDTVSEVKSTNPNLLTLSQCTSMKLGCDGNRPCQTCRGKRIDCTFSKPETRLPAVTVLLPRKSNCLERERPGRVLISRRSKDRTSNSRDSIL